MGGVYGGWSGRGGGIGTDGGRDRGRLVVAAEVATEAYRRPAGVEAAVEHTYEAERGGCGGGRV